ENKLILLACCVIGQIRCVFVWCHIKIYIGSNQGGSAYWFGLTLRGNLFHVSLDRCVELSGIQAKRRRHCSWPDAKRLILELFSIKNNCPPDVLIIFRLTSKGIIRVQMDGLFVGRRLEINIEKEILFADAIRQI